MALDDMLRYNYEEAAQAIGVEPELTIKWYNRAHCGYYPGIKTLTAKDGSILIEGADLRLLVRKEHTSYEASMLCVRAASLRGKEWQIPEGNKPL